VIYEPCMFQIGQSLGDYAIRQELGKGGFGRVFQVEHTLTGRREAMKVLAASSSPEQAERFLREIRVQASLTHPNIAIVHTAFWVNDDLALVCEYLEGQSLQNRLEQQPLTQNGALDVIGQVLQGLSYAHARGIIHRDITPANIFLMSGGPVKIIDFGLAKAATDLRLTQEGSPIGAAHYMSPEQIRGAQEIDARTDVYSCGVVLYELVTGKKPFDGRDSFTIMRGHAEEQPLAPTAANPEVSKELSAIIVRAMSKKPEDRFQSADAFLQAITSLQVPIQTAKLRAPRRTALLTAAVVMVAAIVLLVVAANTTRSQAAGPAKGVPFIVPPPPAIDAHISSPTTAPNTPPVPAKSLRPATQKVATATNSALHDSTKPASPHSPRQATKEQASTTTSTEEKSSSGVSVRGTLKKLNPFRRKSEPAKTAIVAK
jgi:eukaryotic-like serine/threonine-protein kinase